MARKTTKSTVSKMVKLLQQLARPTIDARTQALLESQDADDDHDPFADMVEDEEKLDTNKTTIEDV